MYAFLAVSSKNGTKIDSIGVILKDIDNYRKEYYSVFENERSIYCFNSYVSSWVKDVNICWVWGDIAGVFRECVGNQPALLELADLFVDYSRIFRDRLSMDSDVNLKIAKYVCDVDQEDHNALDAALALEHVFEARYLNQDRVLLARKYFCCTNVIKSMVAAMAELSEYYDFENVKKIFKGVSGFKVPSFDTFIQNGGALPVMEG